MEHVHTCVSVEPKDCFFNLYTEAEFSILNPLLTDSAYLACSRDSLHPPSACWDCRRATIAHWAFTWCYYLNSDHHDCAINALLLALSCQDPRDFFYHFLIFWFFYFYHFACMFKDYFMCNRCCVFKIWISNISVIYEENDSFTTHKVLW